MLWQKNKATETASGERYANPYVAGACLGVLLFSVNMLTGHGLGASGGMSHIIAVATDAVAPNYVDHNGHFAALGRPASAALDHWLVWSLLGVALGAMVSGALAGRLRPRIYRGPHIGIPLRLTCALIGGAFMGYGSQWGRGCTSGQALSGGAVLSLGSWIFMFSIFGGGYALAYFVRHLWK
jgi:hypothetical protein